MERVPKNTCLRCGGKMVSAGVEKIQLGETGFLFGHLSNLLSGAMEAEILICSKCNKVEFYSCEAIEEAEQLAQVICPTCGKEHDFDLPKCPFCKHNYYD